MTARRPVLHVVGAGPWQLATIRRAQQLGCRVLATDGFIDRPGFKVADLHELADITDAAATLRAARRHGVSGVLCDTTDNGVLAAAHVAAELGLPGVGKAAALNCTNKSLMTRCAAAAGLQVPGTTIADTVEAALAAPQGLGPWVIKPVDNQSGRGVSVVNHAAGLPAAINTAFANSRSGRVMVQDFIDGQEVIVDSLVVAGKVHRLGVACKVPYVDNPTVSSRITYGHNLLAHEVLGRLEDTNCRLLQALGVQQGLVHAEFVLRNDHAVPIDVAARGGGVHIYPLVLPHVSGVDAMTCAIELALGRPVSVQPLRQGPGANIEFLRCGPGRVESVRGIADAAALPGVALVHLNKEAGHIMGRLDDKDQRLGHVVTLAASAAEAVQAGVRAAKLISVGVS